MFFEAFLRAPDGADYKIADWSLTASKGSPSLPKGCVINKMYIIIINTSSSTSLSTMT